MISALTARARGAYAAYTVRKLALAVLVVGCRNEKTGVSVADYEK